MLQFIAVLVVSSDPAFIKACSEGLWRAIIAQSVDEARAIIEGPQGREIRAALMDRTDDIREVIEILNARMIPYLRRQQKREPAERDWPADDLLGVRCFNMQLRHATEIPGLFFEIIQELFRLCGDTPLSPLEPEDWILVVEDEEMIRDLLEINLSKVQGVQRICLAPTIEEARKLLQDNASRLPVFAIIDGKVDGTGIAGSNALAAELWEKKVPLLRFSANPASDFPKKEHRGLGVLGKKGVRGELPRLSFYVEYILYFLRGMQVPKRKPRE